MREITAQHLKAIGKEYLEIWPTPTATCFFCARHTNQFFAQCLIDLDYDKPEILLLKDIEAVFSHMPNVKGFLGRKLINLMYLRFNDFDDFNFKYQDYNVSIKKLYTHMIRNLINWLEKDDSKTTTYWNRRKRFV